MLHDSKLTCSEVSNFLDEYCDEQLNSEMSIKVAKHLENCEKCKADVRATKAVIAAFSKLDVLEVTPEFTASLHDKLVQAAAGTQGAQTPPAAKRPLWYLRDWRIYASAAACALIVFVGAYSINRQYNVDNLSVATYIGEQEVQDSSKNPKVSTDTVPGGDAYNVSNSDVEGHSGADESDGRDYAEGGIDAAQNNVSATVKPQTGNTPAPTQNSKSIAQIIADAATDDSAKLGSVAEAILAATQPPIMHENGGITSAAEQTQNATPSPSETTVVGSVLNTPEPPVASEHPGVPGSDITIIFAPPTTRPTATPAPTRQPTPTPTKKPVATPTPTKQPEPEAAPTKAPVELPAVTKQPEAEPEPTNQASADHAPAPIIVAPAPVENAPPTSGNAGGGSATNAEKADVVVLAIHDVESTEKAHAIWNKYGSLIDYDGGKAIKVAKEMYEEFLAELSAVKGCEVQEIAIHQDSKYVYVKVVVVVQ